MAGGDAGADFAQALAAKDFPWMRSLLADNIDFRGLTPGRYWEANTADDVIEKILREWFDSGDQIEQVLACSTDSVGDRHHLSYRFLVRNPDGEFFVEQQMYFDVANGKIALARSLCSGFRSVADHPVDHG